MRRKERAARRDIHLRGGLPEAAAGRVRVEVVGHMLLQWTLVKQVQRDLVSERPQQQRVVLAAHQHEEEGDVRRLAHAVAVEVDAGAHLVAVARRVEGLAVQRQRFARHGFVLAPRVVLDLPQQLALVVGRLEDLEAQVHLRDSHVVDADLTVVGSQLGR